MGIIKTPSKAVRERMNECVDILSKKYLKSVRPIYGSSEAGSPYHIGSCVLVELCSSYYLITAAHVIDYNKITTLYVGGDSDLIQIEADALITKSNTGVRDDDKLDFAILSLSEDVIKSLGGVEFVDESSILYSAPERNGQLYLALGFPNSKNKKINYKEHEVSQTPFIYSSTLNLDEEIYSKVGASKSQHYLLDFCSKHSKDEDNKIVNSIAPKGASGGALIFIEGMNDPENYRPGAKCSGKLVGILIENHKKEKIILATKMSVVKKALTNAS